MSFNVHGELLLNNSKNSSSCQAKSYDFEKESGKMIRWAKSSRESFNHNDPQGARKVCDSL